MKMMGIGAVAMLLTACCGQPESTVQLLDAGAFTQTVDGKPVTLYTLRNGDLTMQVTNFGARVVSLWTPDREGKSEDVVLGYETLDRYLNNKGERFLGAALGRYANRIADGHFTLDGKEYTLPLNDNGRTLHGGVKGFDSVVWDVEFSNDTTIVFRYRSVDGEEGFPGNLDVVMTYTLTPQDEFRIDYQALTDAPTVVNLSHHSFFNLKGEGNGTILDNELWIKADSMTPVHANLIPTGEITPVEGTPFDFRKPTAIGARIDVDNEQLKNGRGYDHNWVLSREGDGVELVASLYEPTTGRVLEVLTDQPGLQFYSGNFFDGKSMGKYGRPQSWRESVALETQHFPDSPNHPNFPSTRLDPDQIYNHTCIYRFSAR